MEKFKELTRKEMKEVKGATGSNCLTGNLCTFTIGGVYMGGTCIGGTYPNCQCEANDIIVFQTVCQG